MDELKFAVIGNPVSHSLSPDIHLFFASQFQLERYTYNKIKSSENDFERDINDFFKNGGVGLNVTVPFKGLASSSQNTEVKEDNTKEIQKNVDDKKDTSNK